MSFGGRLGGEIIRVSGTSFALEVVLGKGWRLCGREKYILVFMTSCSLSSGITLICPGSRTKKGEVCGWISVLFIIQCLLINHAVLMSGSFSTNEPLIEYFYEERI